MVTSNMEISAGVRGTDSGKRARRERANGNGGDGGRVSAIQ